MGRGLVATEWSHAYVSMGIVLSHQSQTALLARVYNLDLAVCFAKAIHQVLRVPVRAGAIWASEDRLHNLFRAGLDSQGEFVAAALEGKSLHEFVAAEVEEAAQATSLANCESFLWYALAPTEYGLLAEIG